MSDDQEQVAAQAALEALQMHTSESAIAKNIKQEFDRRYKPAWNCIVGKHFGSYVTHERDNFIHFTLGKVTVLLFKTVPAP
ncbi:unnamed protein product [Dibothriocephalus latus]|uniref:Dynein light chain n=1 Tax=Dibothriocephalus latus TaxID=60516 RepID=A0A3P7NPJ8_DIBLA|nr:unnamed protein product [Dibothriocephalus latus]